jgi:hypothetical protein
MHTCYFSKKCRFSQGFLEELSKQPFAKEVRLVCVDPSPTRGPLPAWLKIIPTLLVAGSDAPLVGANAVNNWLFERKLMAGGGGSGGAAASSGGSRAEPLKVPSYSPDVMPRAGPAPKGGAPNGIPAGGPMKQGEDGGPAAWHSAEMAGGNWSDKYSFLGDPFTAQHGVNPIVRNFELLGGGGPGAPGGGGGSAGAAPPKPKPQSQKEAKLLADFEAYAAARDSEFGSHRRIG